MAKNRYTFTVGIASAAIYSVLEPIEQATGLTLGDLNAGTGYMVKTCSVFHFLIVFSFKRRILERIRRGMKGKKKNKEKASARERERETG